MTVVIKRLRVQAGSAHSLQIGPAAANFFTAPLNDNVNGVPMPPLVAAYDALAQETFAILSEETDSWSLDWY